MGGIASAELGAGRAIAGDSSGSVMAVFWESLKEMLGEEPRLDCRSRTI